MITLFHPIPPNKFAARIQIGVKASWNNQQEALAQDTGDLRLSLL